ncbi:MAG TPA: response regulator [Rudaea sp.]|jgi:PAS domain S-box-containing protein|nr:response regulator [Rudaea sp.]
MTDKANILLVDDQPARLLSYDVILRDLDENLVHAHSGTEALKLLMAREFAVILLDVNMPEMDGFETASLIHQHPRYEKTPIIFVTGVHVTDFDRLKGYKLGAFDYVYIPVVPEILRAKVSVLVELYNKRRELQTLNRELEQANVALAEANSALYNEKERELSKLNFSLQTANDSLMQTNQRLHAETVQRRAAQEALESSAAVLRAINENTQVLIFVKDADGRVVMANPAALNAVGKSLDDVVGKTDREFLHSADAAAAIMENDRRVIGSRRAAVFEEAIDWPDGRRIYLATKSPNYDASGALLGVISVSVDITEQKNTESALKQEDRRKDEFLAMLAHELRNPLAPLRMVAELMGPAQNLSPRHDEMLQIMRHQVQMMIRLVDDLMEVSRINRGKILLQRRVADFREIIRDAVEISRPLVDAGKHELTIRMPASELMVEVDAVRIAQVVANLLNNAAKYTPDGGRITVEADAEDGCAVARVRDNGIGIPADMIPELFKLFVQGEIVSSRAKGGLGIGLALVRDLVSLHGGNVSASSDGLGKGSQFIIRLPMSAMSSASTATHERQPEPSRALLHKRVLIVDDNESACEAVRFAVEMLGADALVTHDGLSALQRIEQFQPTIVFLDLGLPGMDGHELAREIRKKTTLPQPTLVAITGWGHEQVRIASRHAGIDEHLVKPIGVKDIERLLSSSSQERNRFVKAQVE